MCKKSVSLIICICILVFSSLFTFPVSAAIVNKGVITVGTVSGNVGDTVVVPITIDENPGIAAITVSITYESSVLEFIEDLKGNVIFEYLTKEHPTKNIIRLVTCEQGNKRNNGTLLSLKFKIKDKSPAGFYKIDISYREGDFCNWKLDRIMPTIVFGGVTVNLTTANCLHKSYSSWSVAAIPTCTEPGIEERICNACGHVELRDTAPIGHEFSDKFTIDKEATEKETGLMSRHCIRCSAFTDEISYSLEQSEEGNIDNTIFTEIPSSKYIKDIYKEQYPENETDNSSVISSKVSSKPETVQNNEIITSIVEDSQDSDIPATEIIENIKQEEKVLTVFEKLKENIPSIDKIIEITKLLLSVLLFIAII